MATGGSGSVIRATISRNLLTSNCESVPSTRVAAHEIQLLSAMLSVVKAELKERRSDLDSRLEQLGALEKTSWRLFSEIEEDMRRAITEHDASLAGVEAE